jgi:hypothetical protein
MNGMCYVPVVLPTPDRKAEVMDKIEEILVDDYPAEEQRIRRWVAQERACARCHPVWLLNGAGRDPDVSDEAYGKICDVVVDYYATKDCSDEESWDLAFWREQ